MLKMLRDLSRVAGSRLRDKSEEVFSVELLDLKIREAEQNLGEAKRVMAALLLRLRAEEKSAGRIASEIADLEERACEAIGKGREDLAQQGAEAIAELEDEQAVRNGTIASLRSRIGQIRLSIEKANRRLLSLRQGAVAAKAAVAERRAQGRIERSLKGTTSFREAEELIARITSQRDPFEEAGVLDEIDAQLDKSSVRDRLAEAGCGSPLKSRASDVLQRIAAKAAAGAKPQAAA
ncbi:MAG: PspA/IM30 family protein [Nitratireductor sp.]